ncbi:phosphoglycerate mutase-like protein [Coemansia reversa NRRL 1564]|uniref:Phosphoglycerate mutase-like protein n=1 Tax=Coemansia reversa (strain ATCC 12441 / NRRL 1564) TaxID=763665 RepID=A0A2G5BFP4_COERN|nr:phosphoglycerate mutase-like protein [Coemansia reversa NRRL 1564]|eukprot:PIA17802.1 phosphoglycerate mutase-like protein [Coemansia reversa NRRL 1564]
MAETQLTLYLIRHGETEVNSHNCVQGKRIDPPLNERGKMQAACVGERFKDVAVDWVVTSTAQRAVETGNAIHDCHPQAPLNRFDLLTELNFGDLEGTHVTAGYTDLVAKWDIEHQVNVHAPGAQGESPEECAQRAVACIRSIVQTAAAESRRHVCVVVHSRLIQIVLATLLDGSLETMGAYKQDKGAVNILNITTAGGASAAEAAGKREFVYTAREINSVSHIPANIMSHVDSTRSLSNRDDHDELVRFEIDSSGTLVLRRLLPFS